MHYRIEDMQKQIRRTGQTPEKGNELRYQLEDLTRQYKRLTNESPRQKFKYPKTNQPITFGDALRMLRSGETVVSLQQDFYKSIFKFHDRDIQLKEVFAKVIAVNFATRGTDNTQAFAVVPGGSGIGKTRFGWEAAQLTSNPHFASMVKHNFNYDPSDIVTEYVYIDFKTSERFTEEFDSNETASVRLGGRLAAKALLSKSFQGLATKDASRTLLCKCTASNVLREIVTRVLAPATEKKIVQLVLSAHGRFPILR